VHEVLSETPQQGGMQRLSLLMFGRMGHELLNLKLLALNRRGGSFASTEATSTLNMRKYE